MIKLYLFKTFILVEKGTSNGTVTDVEGNYSITSGQNSTLVFHLWDSQTKEPMSLQTGYGNRIRS